MKIEVPKDLNGIPVKAYQRFLKKEDPNISDTLSILLGIDIRIIRNLKAKSVTELNDYLTTLLDNGHKFERFFEMDGKKFGFIPNLDDASFGEVNDIEQRIGKIDKMHEAMAVMYRPVIAEKNGKYAIEEYVPGKYDDLMKDAPLGIMLGANVFFCDLMKDLSKSILKYMRVEVAQAKSKGILPKNGENLEGYLLSLEEILYGWKQHLN